MDPTEARERADRLRVIAEEMDRIVREIGPKWIRLAHLREEARKISSELGRPWVAESTGTDVQS